RNRRGPKPDRIGTGGTDHCAIEIVEDVNVPSEVKILKPIARHNLTMQLFFNTLILVIFPMNGFFPYIVS
ncbi:MAG TPA: hypothetical protein VFM69_11145, partial [Pricia sp.]|nr:hypothetical protein [Pricia sp.]